MIESGPVIYASLLSFQYATYIIIKKNTFLFFRNLVKIMFLYMEQLSNLKENHTKWTVQIDVAQNKTHNNCRKDGAVKCADIWTVGTTAG